MLAFGVLTVSDRSSRKERPDQTGPSLCSAVLECGWKIAKTDIVPDDLEIIKRTLMEWIQSNEIDVVLTNGGTGFSPRDVTPEATRQVIDRFTPGLDEAMRIQSSKITQHAMLSRSVSGICNKTLIVNLPGNPKAALENFKVISPVLDHAIQLLSENPNSEKGHQI